MTIPTLITNNQEKGWQTSASTFEAKFGQALKVMNTQNTLAGLGSTENFVAELQRHMKINKVCDNSKLTECFTSEINGVRNVIDVADESTWNADASTSKPTKTNTLITADKIGQKTWGTNTMGLQFANGVSAIVAYNPKCSANPFNNNSITIGGGKNDITFDTDCVAMVYDVQAFKNPNELNKDIRTSSRASVEDSCVFRIEGKCVTKEPFIPTPIDGNYWAGAIEDCGGLSNLPTSEQLAQIANYLYDKSSILPDMGQDVLSGIKYDRLKKISLESIKEGSLWANSQRGDRYAYGRIFRYDYTAGGWNTLIEKTSPSRYAICIE